MTKPTRTAVVIAETLYQAGKTRAGSMVMRDGCISFAQWVDLQLKPMRDALAAGRPYVETCANDVLPNDADAALKKINAVLAA
jgi:hypothetical protein